MSISCRSSANLPRSSARSIASGEVPRIGNPSSCSVRASSSGVWPPNCAITPTGRSARQTARTSSAVERLEVQAARRVVVGRDGLGVRVQHHRLEPRLLQGERGVHAGVVELDPLPDPVRPGAQDHDARAGRGLDLRLLLVGGVVVRRPRGELPAAGVDRLEHGDDAERLAVGRRTCALGRARRPRDPRVGQTGPLGARGVAPRPSVASDARRRVLPAASLEHLRDLVDEPRVDRRRVGDLVHAVPRGERPLDQMEATLRAVAERTRGRRRRRPRGRLQIGAGLLEPAPRLAERLLERPPDRHHLADRLHRRA